MIFNFKENFRNYGIVITGVVVNVMKGWEFNIFCKIRDREMSEIFLWSYNYLWNCFGSFVWLESYS